MGYCIFGKGMILESYLQVWLNIDNFYPCDYVTPE